MFETSNCSLFPASIRKQFQDRWLKSALNVHLPAAKKNISGGNKTALRKNKMKAQVSFSLIFLSLHASSFSSPTVNDWTLVHTPGRYRARWTMGGCMLPAEVGFLLFVSGVSNNAISKDSTVPCARPVSGEWSTRESWLLRQRDARAQETTFLRPSHNTYTSASMENELPMDTEQKWGVASKWDLGLDNQCFTFLISLNFKVLNYMLKCNEWSLTFAQMPFHSFLVNLYSQMTNRLIS